MRKHRKWWMGLGLGIVLGALMLQLINFSQEQPDLGAEEGKTYSQDQLDRAIEQAKKEALLAPSQTPEKSGVGEAGSGKIPAASTASAEASQPSAANGSQPSAEPGTEPSASADSQAKDEETKQIVAFYVNKNMDLLTVARSLQTLGVISDADDFTEAARSISKKVEIGTAVFTGKPSYDEIIAELTRSKDD